MTVKSEVRLAGFGGQGIVLAGHILGKAGALFEKKTRYLPKAMALKPAEGHAAQML